MSERKAPTDWVSASLSHAVDVKSGVGFPKKYQGQDSGDYPMYKVGDVSAAVTTKNGLLSEAGHYVTESEAAELKGAVFREGSTLFAKIGEAVKLNRRAFVKRSGLADNNVMAVIPYISDMDRFLYYFLRTVDLSEVSRSTTVPSVRKSDIEELAIAYPPLAEQKIIAQKLDTLLAQVESTKARLERTRETLKRFRQSVLAAAVSGKLTEEWRELNQITLPVRLDLIADYWTAQYHQRGKKFPKINFVETDSLGNLPEGWVSTKIGNVFDVHVGATPSRSVSEYWEGEIPWVSSSEVDFCRIASTKETITKKGLANASTNIHPIGTVMLAMIGQGKTRGQTAILDIEACHNQNTAALRIPAGLALSEFLFFYLTKQYEETRRVGGGNNQKALNKSFVQSLAFPLPPIEEQTEIVRRVEQLFAYADTIEKQTEAALARVNNLTQSILAKAFRGELTAQWRAENPELISGENSAEALLEKIKAERATLSSKKGATKKSRKPKAAEATAGT